jgi:hypothetical protein
MLLSIRVRAALVMLALVWPYPTAAAPSAELWPRWQAHDDASTARIDHSAWSQFLGAYVRLGEDGIARIPYARVTTADREALGRDLARLAQTPISTYSRAEQFAFWVDLYNELTVELVLDHYPVASIRDIAISPGLFSSGLGGGKKLIAIEGEGLSLDDIEHRVLRPIWRDPRILYGVNCAALGCPNLQSEAFTAANGGHSSTRRHAITSTTRAAPSSLEAGPSSPRSMSCTRPISAAPTAASLSTCGAMPGRRRRPRSPASTISPRTVTTGGSTMSQENEPGRGRRRAWPRRCLRSRARPI